MRVRSTASRESFRDTIGAVGVVGQVRTHALPPTAVVERRRSFPPLVLLFFFFHCIRPGWRPDVPNPRQPTEGPPVG